MKAKAFTLVETILVLVIIGILAGVLIQSYLTVSKIAFKVEQEKNLSEEALMITQMFQSIAETATIDYDRYRKEGINLSGSRGFTNILYLTGGQRTGTSISSSPSEGCLPLEWAFDKQGTTYPDPSAILYQYSGCQLLLTKSDGSAPSSILATNKLITSRAEFKVIPFDSERNYFLDPNKRYSNKVLINQITKPAFWMFIHLYSPHYQPVGTNKIDQPLQLFFNLNAPIPSIF